MPEHPSIHLGITGDTVRPRAFGFDELDRAGPYAWPGRPIGERCRYPLYEALRLVRRKEVTRLAITDQFAVTADTRGDDNALLGHCLKRFERRHQFG